MDIKKITFLPRTYLIKRQTINIKNIMDKKMWQAAFEIVHEHIKKHDFKIAGPGSALYFSMNEKTGITDFGIGLPVRERTQTGNAVEGATEISDSALSLVSVPESKAVVTSVHGDYTQLKDAHQRLWQYCKEHKLTGQAPGIEEYEVMGMDKPDPKDWVTNIYYLYE